MTPDTKELAQDIRNAFYARDANKLEALLGELEGYEFYDPEGDYE